MVGEVVYIKDKNNIDLLLNADGTISASISGGTVRILSGDTVNTIIRNIAGTSANVAATSADNTLSTALGLASNGLVTASLSYAMSENDVSWVRLRAIIPASGVGYRLLVSISGEPVSLVAGTQVIANASGGNVYSYGSTIRTNALVTCTNLSGGTNLPSLACVRLMVRSVSGNDVMYIGGTGAQAPFSGTGIELYGGELLPVNVSNANLINIFAATSGNRVSIFAIDK